MNCKPGDLAIVIQVQSKIIEKYIGSIVKVVRPYDETFFAHLGSAWWVDFNGEKMHALDLCLRPIRPDESHEESIEAMRLLHKLPNEVTA